MTGCHRRSGAATASHRRGGQCHCADLGGYAAGDRVSPPFHGPSTLAKTRRNTKKAPTPEQRSRCGESVNLEKPRQDDGGGGLPSTGSKWPPSDVESCWDNGIVRLLVERGFLLGELRGGRPMTRGYAGRRCLRGDVQEGSGGGPAPSRARLTARSLRAAFLGHSPNRKRSFSGHMLAGDRRPPGVRQRRVGHEWCSGDGFKRSRHAQ